MAGTHEARFFWRWIRRECGTHAPGRLVAYMMVCMNTQPELL